MMIRMDPRHRINRFGNMKGKSLDLGVTILMRKAAAFSLAPAA
jgi:hypothetical protein